MRLPSGVRDWLPQDLRRKRGVESVLRSVFARWAYAEVQTPGFERADVLESALGQGLEEKTFVFGDRHGTQLALRPEMTTPIARLVSTRMKGAALPLRLCYVQPVYRHEEPQEGRMREFTQAGVELVGVQSVEADAESLFMAFEALDSLGLRDVQYDVNHVAIVDGIIATLALPPQIVPRVKALVAQRNVVGLREALSAPEFADSRDTLLRVVLMRGTDDVLAFARGMCHTAEGVAGIERLASLLARAAELGLGERVAIDLSLLRDFDYYTGLIFEGFLSEFGFAVAGGGRYDRLLPRFGFEAGAVGWSVSVERLLIALERRHSALFGDASAIDVLVSGSDVIAARERAAGKVVRIDFDRLEERELLEQARTLRIPRVLIASNGRVREIDVTW
jgi:ATP phosphoribosyltransferase regulatory subunit